MPDTNKQSVLIIENDDAVLENLSKRFKKRDMLVITAKDGYEGYTRACKESPDLIVSETLLPSMNGFRVSRLLKFDERYRNIPVVLITSNNLDTVQDMFRASGADQILGKPFRFRDLMEKITGLVAA
ncbi:MAG: response regulator [Candidatus Marinimicrobia bacterium]|nr:response regulator [Candidatus Neomarinimicrobiota bacterium]|tara:strand:- start:318 stop:698 length:381 start_codon:yes stop_codon:yes gene_type:complete